MHGKRNPNHARKAVNATRAHQAREDHAEAIASRMTPAAPGDGTHLWVVK
jgi:hypothetical protein